MLNEKPHDDVNGVNCRFALGAVALLIASIGVDLRLSAGQPSLVEFACFESADTRSTFGSPGFGDSVSRPSTRQLEVHPARPYSFDAVRPIRSVKLINGDTLSGELLSDAEAALELRVLAGSRVRIPRGAVDFIAMPPGERELLSVEISKLSPPPRLPWVLRLPNTDADFRCSFRLRGSSGDSAHPPAFGCAWHFPDGSQLRIEQDAFGRWQAVQRTDSVELESRQFATDRPGWRRCRLLRVKQRLFLSIDEQLLAAGRAPAGGPVGIEFFPTAADPPRPQTVLEHVSFVEVSADRPAEPVPMLRETDQVLGGSGETWWGRLQKLGPDGVTWTDPIAGGETVWRRTWPEIRGVWLRPSDEPLLIAPLFGCVVDLELQPSTDRPDLPGDRFAGVLGASESGRLLIQHPLIGSLAVPHAAIRRVERRFLGEWRLLAPREIHFEAAPLKERPDRSRATPLEGRFSLTELPTGTVFFAVEANGLDPSGPTTLPGSPTLSELRSGQFATELFINNRRVGSFNELTSQWSLPGQFDRLRMLVPRELLRIGDNTWRVSQQPGNSRQAPYDDCRLRNLSLEIEPF